MPLIKSKSPEAFRKNVSTLMSEVGKSPHVKSRSQALAIAYDVKRRTRAEGGGIHVGPINSIVPGRTDKHPMDVSSGSYVIPAETVSNLGENNTNAGMVKLHNVLNGSSEQIRKFFNARPPVGRASGGRSQKHDESPVPINAAGGEFVVPPNVCSIIGYGDIARGHVTLDKWVMSKRKDHIKTLKSLAPPAKD